MLSLSLNTHERQEQFADCALRSILSCLGWSTIGVNCKCSSAYNLFNSIHLVGQVCGWLVEPSKKNNT